MKIATQCVACYSRKLNKKLAFVSPFIAHRICDFPITEVDFAGGTFSPTFFTHSLQCQDCGLVFSQLRYDDEEMARIYQDYRSEEYHRARSLYEPGYAQTVERVRDDQRETQARLTAMMGFLAGWIDGKAIKSVLDHGGDRGQYIPDFPALQKKYVYEVSSAEPVAGVERVADLMSVSEIDMLISSNVLEHVSNPAAIINDMKPLMHKDSLLFVDVPNDLSERDPYPNQFHEHINHFNLRSIQILLRTNGFQIVKAEHVECDLGWMTIKSIYVLARPGWFF